MHSGGSESDSFKMSDKVEARFKGGKDWYSGKINKINRDGSYGVLYDDGDRELRVKPENIRKKVTNPRSRRFS